MMSGLKYQTEHLNVVNGHNYATRVEQIKTGLVCCLLSYLKGKENRILFPESGHAVCVCIVVSPRMFIRAQSVIQQTRLILEDGRIVQPGISRGTLSVLHTV